MVAKFPQNPKSASDKDAKKEKGPDPFWFVLETATGEAGKVSAALRDNLGKLGIADRVVEVRCPTQDLLPGEPEGTPVPGFFLVKMIYHPATWGKVRAFEGVCGFLGDEAAPTPVADNELAFVTRQMARPRRPTKKILKISGDGSDF